MRLSVLSLSPRHASPLKWGSYVIAIVVLTSLPGFSACATDRAIRGADITPLARVDSLLARQRIVVLGTNHLQVEPFETAKVMLKGNPGFTHLALEWPISDQAAFASYMAGDDPALEPVKQRCARLPSVSAEFFELL